MSFNNSFTAVTGATYTAAQYNTHVRDNFTAIFVGTTAGDLDYYTGAAAKARLALVVGGVLYGGASAPAWLSLVSGYKVLKPNAAGNAPEWAPLMQKCIVYKTATQNVTSGSGANTITFENEESDDFGWHSNTVNPERINILADGWYLPIASYYYTRAGGSGQFEAKYEIKVDGSYYNNGLTTIHAIDANPKHVTLAGNVIHLAPGNYFTMTLEQTSGATCTLYGTNNAYTKFTVLRVG
jgi:hypothetical protein